MRQCDWFDFCNAAERIAETERALLGAPALLKMGNFWGDGVNVICVGDEGHAAREAARLHWNRFYGGDRPVSARLPIWC
jgi:hypothetical protein